VEIKWEESDLNIK